MAAVLSRCVLFIATEAMLFVMLLFTYFYLGPYPTEPPPSLRYPVPMLGILLASSAVIHAGQGLLTGGRYVAARAAIVCTLLLGTVFMVLQVREYQSHLRTLTPQSSAYGSIFYTITTVHALHLVLGAAMLGYVLFLPDPGPAVRPPHRAFESAAAYWHFVDAVWVVIVGLVYLLPHVTR